MEQEHIEQEHMEPEQMKGKQREQKSMEGNLMKQDRLRLVKFSGLCLAVAEGIGKNGQSRWSRR